jgi:hypothetical protein
MKKQESTCMIRKKNRPLQPENSIAERRKNNFTNHQILRG